MSAHQPTRFRRARFELRGEAQEKRGDVLLRAGQREAAAGNEIKDFRLTRNLDYDSAQRRASERIGTCLDRIVRMRGTDQKDLRWINAEFEKTGGGKLTEFERRKILADPENLFLVRNARGKTGGESRGGRLMPCRRINFMQRATLEPALEEDINRRETQRNAGIRHQRFQTLTGKSGTKSRELF